MPSLYELTDELKNVEAMIDGAEPDQIDEILASALEMAAADHSAKCLNVACFIKNLASDADAIKAEENRLSARRKAKENLSERLKTYLATNMKEGQKIEDSRAVIGWRKSISVVVECSAESLPEEYQRKTVSISADKALLKEALTSGKKIAGASIETKNNISIR